MLSGGPGDPAENIRSSQLVGVLIAIGMPMFRYLSGTSAVALAIGAKTEKMRFGHRGVNHPVKDLDTGRTYITSQNHGYEVVGETVDPTAAQFAL